MNHLNPNSEDIIKHFQSMTKNLIQKFQGFTLNVASQLEKKLSRTEIEPKFTNINFPLPQLKPNQPDIDQILVWIGRMTKEVFSATFQKYYNHQLSQTEAKCHASENFLLNFLRLAREAKLNTKQLEAIEKSLANNILPYIKTKYPQKGQSKVSLSFKRQIKKGEVDDQQNNQYDLFIKSGVKFQFSQEKQYDQQIMTFLNYIIELPEMKGQIDKRKIEVKNQKEEKQNEEKLVDNFTKYFEKLFDTIIPKKSEQCSDKQYQKQVEKVKQYTKTLSSPKLPIDLEIFSKQQISTGNWNFKKPSLMRVVAKWCEQLRKNFSKPEQIAHKHGSFRMKDGSERDLSEQEGQRLRVLLALKEKKIKTFLKKIKENNLEHKKNFSINKIADDPEFAMLSQEESMVGMFAAVDIKNYEFYLISYLKELIHQCLSVMEQFVLLDGGSNITKNNAQKKIESARQEIRQKLAKEQKNNQEETYYKKGEKIESQIRRGKLKHQNPQRILFNDYLRKNSSRVIDLITFKISDLLRCKCTSKEKEIKLIYNEIQKISKSNPKELKIVRVKNRLDRGTADILINLMFDSKLLVQVQLAIDNGKSRYIDCSDNFNHFIYEVQRAQFGPISQLCSIWNSKNPRADFFLQCFQKIYRYKYTARQKYQKNSQGQKMSFPFECKGITQNGKKCHYYGINDFQPYDPENHFCYQCSIKGKPYQEIQKFLTNLPMSEGSEEIKRVTYKDMNQFPEVGLIIDLKDKKKQVKYFKRIKYKNQQFLIHKEKQYKILAEISNEQQQKKLLESSLIFTHQDFQIEVKNIDEKKAHTQFFIPKQLDNINEKSKSSVKIQQMLEDKHNDSWKTMNSVKKVNLGYNEFSKFDQIIKKFPRVEILNLEKNDIQIIQEIQVANQLKELNLQNNLDTQIKCLEKMPKLEKLCLNRNKIQQMPQSLCGLQNLSSLFLQKNDLTKLPPNFGKLGNLEKIDLSKNKFSEIPISIGQLTKLKVLNLKHNKIKIIRSSFEQLMSLQQLNLSKNCLMHLSQNFVKMENLSKLDLSSNQLFSLPQQFGKLENLSDALDLSKNKLQKLPQSFGSLTKITNLNLSFNRLKQLPKSFGNLQKLQTINLRQNRLSFVSNSICSLRRLTYLNIRSNKLEKLPQNFGDLVSLQYVNLRTNNLKEVPSLQNLSNLKNLHLYENDFTQFPQLPRNNLSQLLLHENKIKIVPESLGQLTNIKTLNLSSNRITKIKTKFEKLGSLKCLYISDNQFNSLPDSFEKLSSLQHCQIDYSKMNEQTKNILNKLKREYGKLAFYESQKQNYD